MGGDDSQKLLPWREMYSFPGANLRLFTKPRPFLLTRFCQCAAPLDLPGSGSISGPSRTNRVAC